MQAIDTANLKAALQEANIPTLLIAIAQLSGDLSILANPERPSRGDIDGTRKMSLARQQEIRDQALALITDYEGALPTLPSALIMQQLASVLVGEDVAEEYVPMLLEDMGFMDSARQRVQWQTQPAPAILNDFKVIIVGGGLSGVCAAIECQRLGLPFVILEKNPALGGTWYENTYPACGVDTPNHFYSYSFEPNAQWSGFYSKRDELYHYINDVATKYNLLEDTRLNTEVISLTWQEETQHWQVVSRDIDGNETLDTANIVLSAVGQVNRPMVPEFAGKTDFQGPAFHSSQWDHGVDLAGKRVVVIGTGASAMQFAPEIAKAVSELTIFQRSAHWIRILPDYHRQVGPGKQWLLTHVPFYRNWYRFKLFWAYGDGIWDSIHTDPDWPHPERSLNAENERHRQVYIRNLTEALNGDQALLDKVIPDYPPFAKRMLIDNHWCAALQQENVHLLASGVSRVTRQGVVDDSGIEHEADVIIYATGFQAHQFLWPITVTGAAGKTLADTWNDDARAYLGMSTPDFPNLFFFYGPNTNLGHGGSLIFHIECQARYIAQCLIGLIESGQRRMEVRQDPHDEYNARVDAEHNRMVWTHPGVNNWYKNRHGRVVSNSPWRLVDYWHMTHTPNLQDYRLSNTQNPP